MPGLPRVAGLWCAPVAAPGENALHPPPLLPLVRGIATTSHPPPPPTRYPQGMTYAVQCAAAAAYGHVARDLTLAARLGNAQDRARARARPLLGLGLTLPAIIWAGALGFWGAAGVVSPILALATGSPLVNAAALAKQYADAPRHPAMPASSFAGHPHASPTAGGSASGQALNSSAGWERLDSGPASPGDSVASPGDDVASSSSADPLAGASAGVFLAVFPCSMAGVSLTLSQNSVVSVVPAMLVGAAAAASGAVVSASGVDAVDVVAHSRWLYYRLLSGPTPTTSSSPSAGGSAGVSGSASTLPNHAFAMSRDAAHRLVMGHLAVTRQSAEQATLPVTALALWAAPAVAGALVGCLLGVAVVRRHGRLSMHRQADRPHLAARGEEEADETAAMQASAAGGAAAMPTTGSMVGAAALNGMEARPGADPRVTVTLGVCGRALRVAFTFVSAACALCCRCGRAGRGRATSRARRPCSLSAGPGWDAEGRHWAAAEAEPPSAPPPPDPSTSKARFRRRRRRLQAADVESHRLLPGRAGENGNSVGAEAAGATATRSRSMAATRDNEIDRGATDIMMSDDESTGGSDDGFAGRAIGRGRAPLTAVEVTSGTATPLSILWWRSVEPLPAFDEAEPIGHDVSQAAARAARAE